jgi:predicted HTH transcriptional regulator
MIRQCESAGLKAPHMIESGLFFKIIFFKPDSSHSPTTRQLPDTTRQLPATTRKNAKIPLNQFENYPVNAKKIIQYIQETPDITRKELARRLGMTENGVKYHIKNLTQDGIIKRMGKQWCLL